MNREMRRGRQVRERSEVWSSLTSPRVEPGAEEGGGPGKLCCSLTCPCGNLWEPGGQGRSQSRSVATSAFHRPPEGPVEAGGGAGTQRGALPPCPPARQGEAGNGLARLRPTLD